MKIAFVGQGGAGKTTLTALFARRLACANDRVGEDLAAQVDPEFTLLLVRS